MKGTTADDATVAWTFVDDPSPAATCAIDQGVGTITSGAVTSVTLR